MKRTNKIGIIFLWIFAFAFAGIMLLQLAQALWGIEVVFVFCVLTVLVSGIGVFVLQCYKAAKKQSDRWMTYEEEMSDIDGEVERHFEHQNEIKRGK